MACRSSAAPAKPAAASGDLTSIESRSDRDAVNASAKPIANTSVSPSAGTTRNGSTTSRVTGTTRGMAPELRASLAARTAAAISTAVWYRSSGRFSSARRAMRSTASTEASPTSAGGRSWSTACIDAICDFAANGDRPVTISNSRIPAANRSVRPSTRAPSSCSGAM